LTFNGDEVGGLSELETGDVNGDSVPDVVVTRLAYPPAHKTYPVGIILGNGHGGFTDGSSLWDGPASRTEHGRQILIADFNGDRRNDIFVADHGYDAEPFPGHPNALALSTAQGKLVDASGNLPPESGFSHSAAAADVNRDGSLDIYVGNLCCGDHTPPEILLNDGSGHFTRRLDLLPPELQDTNSRTYTRSLFVDANSDGAPDLVLGAFQTPDSAVLLNDGTGHFRFVPNALPAKPFGPTAILISLASFDINNDRVPDLLAGFQHADFTGRRIQVLIGNGDGTFRDETGQRLPTQDEGQGWPYAIRVGDVNGDGSLDFGVSVYQAPSEHGPLYLNDGTGVFHPVALPATSQAFLFLDANRDGHVDLFDAFAGGPGGQERDEVQLQLVRPAAPTRLRASRNRRDRIVVIWRAVPGATGYQVWRSRRGRGRHVVGRTFRARFDDRRVARRVAYIYAVRAVNQLGPGAFSARVVGKRR
jgi:FG-GAP-like repeat